MTLYVIVGVLIVVTIWAITFMFLKWLVFGKK
jgi:hypothetical protein